MPRSTYVREGAAHAALAHHREHAGVDQPAHMPVQARGRDVRQLRHGMGRRLLGPDPTTRVALTVAVIATYTVAARRLGYGLGGDVPVRCRRGHLFTTLWIPGVNLKALDLGPARIQWCPVGKHWSPVTPLRKADLTADEQRSAAAHHDLRIP